MNEDATTGSPSTATGTTANGNGVDAKQNGEAAVDPVAGKSVAQIFGEIVWVMSRDPEGKKPSVGDLEWLVMAPIMLRQFHIEYAEVTPPGAAGASGQTTLQPITVELIAMCSDAVARAIDADTDGTLKLAPNDWRSGTTKRVVRRFVIDEGLRDKSLRDEGSRGP